MAVFKEGKLLNIIIKRYVRNRIISVLEWLLGKPHPIKPHEIKSIIEQSFPEIEVVGILNSFKDLPYHVTLKNIKTGKTDTAWFPSDATNPDNNKILRSLFLTIDGLINE